MSEYFAIFIICILIPVVLNFKTIRPMNMKKVVIYILQNHSWMSFHASSRGTIG